MTCRPASVAVALAVTLASGTADIAAQLPDQSARLREQLKQAQAFEPGRDRTHQIDKALDSLGLRPGMTVAEVGAGPGYLVEKLARGVGPGGRVYAEDVSARMLGMLTIRMADRGLANYETILGTETDPKLPAARLDMVLIHATRHFVEAPVEVFRNIVPSLKPGGRLVLIEPVREQAADPSGRHVTDSRYRTREAFEDIFSKASLWVERIDSTTLPYDTVFVLTAAARR